MASPKQVDIIEWISHEILNDIKRVKMEESNPQYTPDASDDFIKTTNARISQLREIRAKLEELFS